jgi:hypothetical protein
MTISVGGILLGLVNIAIVVVLLLLVGAIAWWIIDAFLKTQVPTNVQQLYIAFVALVALYMIIALIFGLPSITVIRG